MKLSKIILEEISNVPPEIIPYIVAHVNGDELDDVESYKFGKWVRKQRTKEPILWRLCSEPPDLNGKLLELDEPTSFTSINLESGQSMGNVGFKSSSYGSDYGFFRIENPTIGYDVDYDLPGIVSWYRREAETILCGRYILIREEKVRLPNTYSDFRVPVLVFQEFN